MKVIILNGPPRSGKDIAATFIKKDMRNVGMFTFKRPLVAVLRAIVPVDNSHHHTMLNTDLKDVESQWCGGLTPRQLMIKISEEWIKPVFGNDHLGKLAAYQIQTTPCEFAVFPDGGFDDEVKVLAKTFGYDNIYVIHIHRPGCNYDDDSRSYINLQGIYYGEIVNRFDLELYRTQIRRLLTEWKMPITPPE
jgi:hypothetical protein